MNLDKIVIKWSQRSSLDDALVRRFLSLPYKNKIAFVSPKCQIHDKQIITIPELDVLNFREGDETPYTFKYFDVLHFLNKL